jgi:prophage DNA circulation protein
MTALSNPLAALATLNTAGLPPAVPGVGLINLAAQLLGFNPANLGPWAAGLQPAAWRGVPFAVRESAIVRGRRVVVHEYPYRDTVYVEDLGRGMRRYRFRGFLVGDDVYWQRSAFLAMAEVPGPGLLVHPSLGPIQASLVGCAVGEASERGRLVELDLEFIESGTLIFPALLVATQNNVLGLSAGALAGVQSSFAAAAAVAINLGGPAILGALPAASSFITSALNQIINPSAIAVGVHFMGPLVGAADPLSGPVGGQSLGLYDGGNIATPPALTTPLDPSITTLPGKLVAATPQLLAAVTANRALASTYANQMQSAANNL